MRCIVLGSWMQDLRFAVRALRRQPGFTVVAVLTLALGIGASTAVFSLVNGVLLKPLALRQPDRLFAVYSANHSAGRLDAGVSPLDVDDWRAQQGVFTDLGGYWFSDGLSGLDLTGGDEPQRLSTVFVTPGFFGALAVTPEAGRLPREDELVRGGRDRVVVLTHEFWQRQFGGAHGVLGTSLTLNGAPYEVLGVLPPDLRFPTEKADVFVPYSTIPDDAIPRRRFVRLLRVVARAKPGVTRSGAQAEMRMIARRLAQQYPENAAWDDATVRPLRDTITGSVRTPLLVLLGAVGFVLLMVCVNVAGLQLARATGRDREVAVRASLGASRGRIVRQLLTESLVLAGAGCLAGVALAQAAVTLLLRTSTGQLPRAWDVNLDLRVLGFAIGVSLLTGVLFGLVPALHGSAADPRRALHRGSRSTVGGRTARMRNALVVGEVALAMMLVVGAGLMTRSFVSLLRVDPGFVPENLVAVQFSISTERHEPGFADYYQEVIDRVRTLPAVITAGAVKDAPLRGSGELVGFTTPGMVVPAGEDPPLAAMLNVSDGFFRTIGARMLDGREFTPRDGADAPRVAVVNEAFAKQWFPGERAVGKRLLLGSQMPFEIVGVVNDIRQLAIAEPARPTLYLDNHQNSRVKTTLVARVHGEPLAAAQAIQEAIWSLDREQTITGVFTFDQTMTEALGRPRLLTTLLVGFGIFGLLIGALGVFGVLTYLVNQRQREIGLRLALGAAPGAVLAAFARHGLRLAGMGVALGLAGALALSRFVGALLYGVTATDPATLAAMAGLLLGIALLASWLPARRASRVDPMEALRHE
jgi:putative ABC transport system permease protein